MSELEEKIKEQDAEIIKLTRSIALEQAAQLVEERWQIFRLHTDREALVAAIRALGEKS
jgi:hypothetical protein